METARRKGERVIKRVIKMKKIKAKNREERRREERGGEERGERGRGGEERAGEGRGGERHLSAPCLGNSLWISWFLWVLLCDCILLREDPRS